jgi:hypothetical protein
VLAINRIGKIFHPMSRSSFVPLYFFVVSSCFEYPVISLPASLKAQRVAPLSGSQRTGPTVDETKLLVNRNNDGILGNAVQRLRWRRAMDLRVRTCKVIPPFPVRYMIVITGRSYRPLLFPLPRLDFNDSESQGLSQGFTTILRCSTPSTPFLSS